MHDKRKILNIERSLGFKWVKGVSGKPKESCKVPIIKTLLNDIEPLKHQFVHHLPKKLRGVTEFQRHCEDLFLEYGPRLWPDPSIDRSGWLVDADENKWDGLYSYNLYYQDPKHREKLRELFTDVVFEKCVRYHENQKQERKREEQRQREEAISRTQADPIHPSSESEEEIPSEAVNANSDKSRCTPSRAQRQAARTQLTSARTSAEVDYGRTTIAPIAVMVPDNEADNRAIFAREETLDTTGYDSTITNQEGLEGASLAYHQDLASQEQPTIRPPVTEVASTPSKPVCRCPVHISQKRPLSPPMDIEYTRNRANKLPKVHDGHEARASLICKLKLTPEKLASITQICAPSATFREVMPDATPAHDAHPGYYGGLPLGEEIRVASPSPQGKQDGRQLRNRGARALRSRETAKVYQANVETEPGTSQTIPAHDLVQSLSNTPHASPHGETQTTTRSEENKDRNSTSVARFKDMDSRVAVDNGWPAEIETSYSAPFDRRTCYNAEQPHQQGGTPGPMNPPPTPALSEHLNELRSFKSRKLSTVGSELEHRFVGGLQDAQAVHEDSVFEFDSTDVESGRADSLDTFGHYYGQKSWPISLHGARTVRTVSGNTERPTSSSLFNAFCRTSVMSPVVSNDIVDSTSHHANLSSASWNPSASLSGDTYTLPNRTTIEPDSTTEAMQNVETDSSSRAKQSERVVDDTLASSPSSESLKSLKGTGRLPPSIQPPQSNTPIYEVSTSGPQLSASVKVRTLNINLTMQGSKTKKFISVGADITVAELFAQVQKRVDRTLGKQKVEVLRLRLEKWSTDDDSWGIESDDPDTWRFFLKHIAGVDGDEIDVIADVEV